MDTNVVKANLIAILVFLTFGCLLCFGQTEDRSLKSAFVLKFCSYVDWPKGTFTKFDSKLIIAVAGSDEVIEQLKVLSKGRYAGGRAFEIVDVDNLNALSKAHVLYMAEFRPEVLPVLEKIGRHSVLTITDDDIPNVARKGVINFIQSSSGVKFEVYLWRAENVGIKISAPLLSVSSAVHKVM